MLSAQSDFISHHLASLRFIADAVAAVYLAGGDEIAPIAMLSPSPAAPTHPRALLLSAAPVPDPSAQPARVVLRGEPPRALRVFPGSCFPHPLSRGGRNAERPAGTDVPWQWPGVCAKIYLEARKYR